ncbi:hypothetical protein CDL12_18566 [Handroanthus impetiginosus]|uniref:TMEM205-like domain-containing protein n=1 Tax=Handroanthus impetiginosus TaxID=429701 RepID=A0A2G9GU82_9LAMI|nr:hypothetical protein CDL12_18566 [Handroanthus impetiginosus]
MMKALSLCFLFTSLISAGFFAPGPEKHNSRDDVLVKEGHKGVVIELEKNDGNTKVLISPQDAETDAGGVDEKGYVTNAKEKLSGKVEHAKENIKEASSSVLPEVGKEGDSAYQEEGENHHKFRPRELVCDAYGKCKHKIAGYMGKTKEAAVETAHEAAEKVYEAEEGAKEAVSEAIGKVQDTVTHTARTASDKAQEMKESMKDAASEVPRKATEKASEVKEGAKQVVDDAIHTTKKAKEQGERKVREKAKGAEELAETASDIAKHGVHGVKEEGKKGLRGIVQRVGRVLSYIVSPVRMSSVAGVLHLLGFASAYGMSVWVTFASSYVLAGILARHQFAMVQSKIYPVYFKAMATGVGMALVGHLMGRDKRFSPLSLVASLVTILVNLFHLEPRATKVMFERMKKEKEEGRGKEGHATEPSGSVLDSTTETAAGRGTTGGGATATAEEATQEKQEKTAAKRQVSKSRDVLRRLNSYSSLLNVATLMSLTWHLVCLGQHIYSVC